MEIAPGVFYFTTGLFNWYVVEEAGRLTVIDGGFPGHYRLLTSGLDKIGKTIQDVEAILVTHAHADHLGFIERLRTETNKPVYAHREDHEAASRSLQLPWSGLLSNAWRGNIRRMLLHATVNGVFSQPSVKKLVASDHDDRLEVPGRPIVLHTPGHTPGELCFFLPDRQALFTGDAIVTKNLMTGQDGSPQIAASVLNADHKKSMNSLDRLRDLGPITLLPGHGPAWKGVSNEAVELAREAHRRG